MPYKNIVFVKLEKRLLNDSRWWSMSEPAQLIYIKLILLAAETYNKIPLNDNILRDALRSKKSMKDFQNYLKEIEKNFPKLCKNKHFRYFIEFETKTNYIPNREIPRKSPGCPKVVLDKDKDKDNDKDKMKIDEVFLFLKNKDFEIAFNAFIEMRKKIGKPITDHAKDLLLKKLSKEDIKTAIAMLEQSIVGSWTGIYELKKEFKDETKQPLGAAGRVLN